MNEITTFCCCCVYTHTEISVCMHECEHACVWQDYTMWSVKEFCTSSLESELKEESRVKTEHICPTVCHLLWRFTHNAKNTLQQTAKTHCDYSDTLSERLTHGKDKWEWKWQHGQDDVWVLSLCVHERTKEQWSDERMWVSHTASLWGDV